MQKRTKLNQKTSAILLITIAILFAEMGHAQTFTGTITGVVTDQAGALVADAQISLTSVATGEVREQRSNSDGRFNFAQLQPGFYSLRVVQAGFREYQQTRLQLLASQTLETNVEMQTGAASETVTISANLQLLDTQTANQSFTLESKQVTELPLIGRNPFALFHTQAGVVAPRTGVSGSTSDQNQNRFSINGGRSMSVRILVDGIPVVAGDWGGLIASPGVDAVSEFQMLRNTYDAQYGRTAGAVINLTTKSGTQEFHGTAFGYLRNDNLDANSFFNNRNRVAKQEFKRAQFGGTIGGPVWKSRKLYGFFGYEGLRDGSPATRISTVPTERERNGDFSQSFNVNGTPITIFDPATTVANPAIAGRFIRTGFTGNIIPSNRLDPVAVAALRLLPLPNRPGRTAANLDNFIGVGTNINNNDRYDARVDWVATEKYTIFGRFTRAAQESRPAVLFPIAGETNRDSNQPRFMVSIGNTWTISPTLILNLQLGGGKWVEGNVPKLTDFDATTLGFPAAIARSFDVAVPPQFNLADYATIGNTNYSVAARSTWSVQTNLSKQLASHSIKFGYTLENYILGVSETQSATFNFNRFFTVGPDPDLRGAVTAGNTIASFLLGAGAGGNAPRNARNYANQAYHSWYIQDAWNVNSRLTLNGGLRYELQRGRTERYNRLNYFDFNAASPLASASGIQGLRGGLVFVNDDNPHQWDTPTTDLAPRVGLAYKVSDRIVARAGYGIYFQPSVNTIPIGNDGFSITTDWVSTLDSGRTITNPLRNAFPTGLIEPTGASLGLGTAVGTSIRTFQKDRPTPYVQQFSADLQWELGRGALLEVGYAGSQGRRLAFGFGGYAGGMNINQIPSSALALGTALRESVPNPFFGVIARGPLAARTVERRQLLRPYPQFLDVNIIDMPGASSNFNAFTARFQKRFSDGMMVAVSYQYSKAMDNSSENQGWEVSDQTRNYYDLSAERSVSAHDIPQSLAVTYVYELPFGKGRKLGNNWHPVVNAIAGGWQMNAIFKADSGLPLIFTAPNNSFTFAATQQPNIRPGADLRLANRTIDRWFNTDAFSQPADFTFGNAPRFIDEVRYSGTNNWDLAVAKNFRPLETMRIQFRAEMFNAFNRVQFGRANSAFGNPAFGRVTGTAPGNTARTIQMALRIEF
ncbi:MAG: TonB-dependent receptor domain-containing protein [Blastocatellia bacterium]